MICQHHFEKLFFLISYTHDVPQMSMNDDVFGAEKWHGL